ncbi:MAG: hypothetical protein BMS9Abin18_0443 [Zetaproteobacteria bacterium]|nr:MAG: hypothetical protein BMS9Abin18_0443 [Zetaproteobacteria bacterium]
MNMEKNSPLSCANLDEVNRMKQEKNILSLDAAFGPACACLIRQDARQFYVSSQSNKPHSQTILPMLETLLAEAELNWKDVQLLGLGIGPGSFTGLRVAAATMTGINADLRLPMLGFSSLAITARQSSVREPMWVIEDARAGSAWLGRYQEGMPLEEDRSQPWDEVRCIPADTYLTQTPTTVDLPGWEQLPLELPRCKALAILTCQQASKVANPDILSRFASPAYLSPSQAERNAQKG